MGLTPAHDGVIPVNRNHADSLGYARGGRSTATSVDVARIVCVHASHSDVIGVAKGEIVLDCSKGVGLTGEK
eukprot:5995536-Pleurochrysis_carterae.AAC.1